VYSTSEHGFTLWQKAYGRIKYCVLYNDWKDDTTVSFTLAHEAGHIVLKHLVDNIAYDVAEKEANCFARNLLCPIYIRNLLDLTSIQSICDIFHVSEPMARVARDKAPLDYYHIDKSIYQEMAEMLEWQCRLYKKYRV